MKTKMLGLILCFIAIITIDFSYGFSDCNFIIEVIGFSIMMAAGHLLCKES